MPLFLVLLLMPVLAAASTPPVTMLTIDGPITPTTADYFTQGLSARSKTASLVVLKMDTPGGLDTSMRGIIKHILASPSRSRATCRPPGARGERRHLHPVREPHRGDGAGTNLGAATPVQSAWRAGSEPNPPPADGPKEGRDRQGAEAAAKRATMTRKQTNDAAAYIRGLAQLRGRNADWAEQAVREAVSLSAQEALKMNVID